MHQDISSPSFANYQLNFFSVWIMIHSLLYLLNTEVFFFHRWSVSWYSESLFLIPGSLLYFQAHLCTQIPEAHQSPVLHPVPPTLPECFAVATRSPTLTHLLTSTSIPASTPTIRLSLLPLQVCVPVYSFISLYLYLLRFPQCIVIVSVISCPNDHPKNSIIELGKIKKDTSSSFYIHCTIIFLCYFLSRKSWFSFCFVMFLFMKCIKMQTCRTTIEPPAVHKY